MALQKLDHKPSQKHPNVPPSIWEICWCLAYSCWSHFTVMWWERQNAILIDESSFVQILHHVVTHYLFTLISHSKIPLVNLSTISEKAAYRSKVIWNRKMCQSKVLIKPGSTVCILTFWVLQLIETAAKIRNVASSQWNYKKSGWWHKLNTLIRHNTKYIESSQPTHFSLSLATYCCKHF